MQQDKQNTATESNVYVQSPSGKEEDVKKMNVNPDPRANENVDESDKQNTNTSGVGSEITDGEAG